MTIRRFTLALGVAATLAVGAFAAVPAAASGAFALVPGVAYAASSDGSVQDVNFKYRKFRHGKGFRGKGFHGRKFFFKKGFHGRRFGHGYSPYGHGFYKHGHGYHPHHGKKIIIGKGFGGKGVIVKKGHRYHY